MQIRRLATLGGVAALTVLSLPSSAAGATFTALKPCYVSLPGTNPATERIDVAGTGFLPNVPADIDIDGARSITGAPVDAAGNLALAPSALPASPFIAARDKPFQVAAFQNGVAVAAGASQVTALDVGLSPTRARPSRRITFRGRGFTGPGRVYAHYRFKGRTRATVSFRPTGPCGTFSAKRRQIPVSNPGTGQWTVQFDQQRRYSRAPSSVFVRLTILVTRTVRFDRAATVSGL